MNMNLKKLNLGLVALVLGFGLVISMSAFKGTDQGDKPKSTTLYWYQVTYDVPGYPDGYIVDGDALIAHEEKENVELPCDAGDAKDCVRGFTSQITSFPSEALGVDKIMRAN